MIHVALDHNLAVQQQYKVNYFHLHVTFDVLVYSRTPCLPKPGRIEGCPVPSPWTVCDLSGCQIASVHLIVVSSEMAIYHHAKRQSERERERGFI